MGTLERKTGMSRWPRRKEAISGILAAAGTITLCVCLLVLGILQERFAPLRTQKMWDGQMLGASSGVLTITAPSRETVHTTVNHGLGSVPVALVLGLDLPGFDYYEIIDDRRESGGTPAEIPVHLSAMVRKPYNGTFTVRLKHYLGGQRTFTVRWLAIKLETHQGEPSGKPASLDLVVQHPVGAVPRMQASAAPCKAGKIPGRQKRLILPCLFCKASTPYLPRLDANVTSLSWVRCFHEDTRQKSPGAGR